MFLKKDATDTAFFRYHSKGFVFEHFIFTYMYVDRLDFFSRNRFTPEQLGITASYGLVWLFVEIMAILFSLYIFNVQAEIKTLDLVAFCGYKYVG